MHFPKGESTVALRMTGSTANVGFTSNGEFKFSEN